jgi:Cu(I)/Ag(I) efflux system membrane fusion protein
MTPCPNVAGIGINPFIRSPIPPFFLVLFIIYSSLKQFRKMKKVIILLVAIAGMSIGSVSAQHSEHQHSQEVVRKQDKTEAKGTQATLTVQGKCGMCKTRIEKAAKSVTGVTSAQWNGETKALTFTYDEKKTSPDAVGKAVAKVGHDTDKYKAEDKVYNALPGCCKYR